MEIVSFWVVACVQLHPGDLAFQAAMEANLVVSGAKGKDFVGG